MPIDKLIVFKGRTSMTGLATNDKFPGLEALFVTGDSFDSILKQLKNKNYIAVLPIWNSHVGEIPRTQIFDYISKHNLLVHSIWPSWIDFSCIVRKGTGLDKINTIISMKSVADKQCSTFIENLDATFYPADSTPDAYKKFCQDNKNEYDAVLCAETLCNTDTQDILEHNASNKLNFTTFVLLGKAEDDEWSGERWKPLNEKATPKECCISCIEMPSIEGVLSEEQIALFESLSEDCVDVNEIPKVIFATSRDDDAKVLLLLEYKKFDGQLGFPDIAFTTDVKITNNAGSTRSLYASDIQAFVEERNQNFSKKDFIKHDGFETCFFACPPLHIVVHGFNIEVAESIARQSIGQHFKAYIQGEMTYTSKQKIFFENYRTDYLEQDVRFPIFVPFP